MDWPTIATSVGTAVIVAFLAPRFQHFVWKAQRLREQRIAIAERFAKINISLPVFTHSAPPPTSPTALQIGELYIEQFALLALIQVLFNDRETLAVATTFREALDRAAPDTLSPEQLQKLGVLRADLQARLFAEAFGISANKLTRRASPK